MQELLYDCSDDCSISPNHQTSNVDTEQNSTKRYLKARPTKHSTPVETTQMRPQTSVAHEINTTTDESNTKSPMRRSYAEVAKGIQINDEDSDF